MSDTIHGFDFYKTQPAYQAGFISGLNLPGVTSAPSNFTAAEKRLWNRGRNDGIQRVIDEALPDDASDMDTEDF